ncbi:MAG: SDR family NAD(P)-dependent oxidoreductase, partial [Candidatus Limnocylindria bacterium]|nr:SDR family NAD(P)-dependent oxidoreductase [Candidatus Limnocylindria bacterium]
MSDRFGLAGRGALVTGGIGGIGRATVRALADAGARVIAADRVVAEVEGAEATLTLDVADPSSVEAAIERAHARLGRLDILVNAAGVTQRVPSLEVEPADWDALQDVNLRGTFLCCQAAARVMLANGGG